MGKDLRSVTNRWIGRWSAVGDPPLFDPRTFPFTSELEKHWETVRGEADALLARGDLLPAIQEISPDHARLARGDRLWRTFFLWGYGHRFDASCARCPETARLVDAIPALESAFFSILLPGSRLSPHRGPTKALLTCHLGLHVPEGECGLTVEGREAQWEAGRTLIFDDTRHHSAFNRTEEARVVLLVHFRRPTRLLGSFVGRSFLRAIKLSPFIRDALHNQREWQGRFDAAWAERDRRDAGPLARGSCGPSELREAGARPPL